MKFGLEFEKVKREEEQKEQLEEALWCPTTAAKTTLGEPLAPVQFAVLSEIKVQFREENRGRKLSIFSRPQGCLLVASARCEVAEAKIWWVAFVAGVQVSLSYHQTLCL